MISYKEKLMQFNATEKYKREQSFFINLMNPQQNERILDYGCGLGRMVHVLRSRGCCSFGYDVNNLVESSNEFLFKNSFHIKFSKVYFMHSFSHIPSVNKLISETLKQVLDDSGKVFIFSPNPDWLKMMPSNNYIPDPTVVRHYSLNELQYMFGKEGYLIESCGQYGPTCSAGFNERLFFSAKLK